MDPCKRAGDANQCQGALVARPDPDGIGWIRAGREEMEDPADPCQQTSSPYIARGRRVHPHPALYA